MAKKEKNRGILGTLLWKQRKQQKLTMLRLAQAVDVSESYISLLESGTRKQPTRELVLKLAHALGARSTNQLADQFLLAAGYYPADKQMYENHGDTIQAYQDEIRRNPENYPAYDALIFAYIKLGKKEKAQELIATALSTFENNYQLTSLSASLALSQQDFKQAIKLQKQAIKSLQPKASENQPYRLRLNLAVMYFLKGLHHQEQWFSEQKVAEQKKAKKDYQEAHSLLKTLLSEENNVYALDEYARVVFNQAFIKGEDEETLQKYWQISSQTFKEVLAHPDKFSLGRQLLSEACVFLAHAYSHQKKFSLAETLIHTLEVSTNPSTALIYYLKACFHSLRGATQYPVKEAKAAIKALETAYELDPKFTQQALYDSDLNWLREQEPELVKAILKGNPS